MNDPVIPICGILCIWPLLWAVIAWWVRGLVINGTRLRSPFYRDDPGYGRSPVQPRPMNASPAGKAPAPQPVKKVE